MRFAVDDVGAGYSGLSQLATLRPTYIKLDRTLVRGLDTDPVRVALVRALADYARGAGGLLVAEGIETTAELIYVRAAGAPLGQGYLLARPGPPWPKLAPGILEDPPVARATKALVNAASLAPPKPAPRLARPLPSGPSRSAWFEPAASPRFA